MGKNDLQANPPRETAGETGRGHKAEVGRLRFEVRPSPVFSILVRETKE